MIELTVTNAIVLLASVFGGGWTLIKVIAVQFERGIKRDLQEQFKGQETASKAHYTQLNMRLDALDAATKADTGQWQRVERELLTLKADMPLNYVRREDYIRGQSVLEAKIDGLGTKVENVLLRALNSTN
ncbi:MAG: hypothetical protein PHT20_08315 [Rhodoferax sp.]|nr:hypothetical protein [Rhodoferax sp.]